MKSPFKFLDSYQKEDKNQFFGREQETKQLLNAVHASNLVLLYGASGTGKTSLINCGLGNQFQKSDWLPIFIRRGNELNDSLHKELDKLLPPQEGQNHALRFKISDLYHEYYRPVYLIFDQFEELYITGRSSEQEAFHQNISELLQSGLKCKIILSIREEYIAYLSEFEKVVPSLFDNRLRIEKMKDRNLIRVVMGTCKYGNIRIEEARKTVIEILNNLRSKRDGIDLTHLQVYLDRLWRNAVKEQGEREDLTFDLALVNRVGKVENVLSDFLDEQMKEVEGGLKKRGIENTEGLPLEILFTLVTEDGTKRNMQLADILDDLPKNRNLSEADLVYCMEEFHRIKLLRQFADD